MELGRRMGGWRRVEEGGCRQDQRAVLVRAFEGRWRSGIEGGWRGRRGRGGTGHSGRERVGRAVHAGGREAEGWVPRARGSSNGAGGPEGRWVAMLRGWRRQRANLIFAPLAIPLTPPPFSESPLSSILPLDPPTETVRVSLTHNTPARSLYLAISFTRYIRPRLCYRYRRRRRRRRSHCRCFGVSSTLAYFAQSVPMYSAGCSPSLSVSVCRRIA